MRFGRVRSLGRPPVASQHYYDFSELPEGMGAVVDIVEASTASELHVRIKLHSKTPMDGTWGRHIGHLVYSQV